jgi:hypothetical protein
MQLWLDACPQRENPLVQKIAIAGSAAAAGLAGRRRTVSSCASRYGSTISIWRKASSLTCSMATRLPAVDSRHGACRRQEEEKQALTCGDGAFIRDEANITLVADTPLRALLIDLPV